MSVSTWLARCCLVCAALVIGLISLSRLAAAQDPCIICPPDPGPNYFVGVSPDNQSAGPYAARVTGQQLTFTIANGGSQPAAYGLSCSLYA